MMYQDRRSIVTINIIAASTTIFIFICPCYTDIGSLALTQKSSCSCSGYTVTYECTVMGTRFGNTVWRGSAFNCSLEEILLQHRLFPENARGECNDGSVIGKGFRVNSGTYYTSQLNVTISSDLVGKSIECFYDDNTGMKQLVGAMNFSVTLISDQFQPPNINEPPNLTSGQVTFSWSPVVPDCPAIHYNILASNCGSCPTTTNHTTVTCTDVSTTGGICAFSVQTVVCRSNFSDTIYVGLTHCASPSNLQWSVFTGAIISAALLGGIIGACITIFITVIIKQKIKAQCQDAKPESPNRLYEDVYHKQSSSAIINTRKNVAYGQVAS